jgi:hypothetical protein
MVYEVWKCPDCRCVHGCKWGDHTNHCEVCPPSQQASCAMHETAERKWVYCADCKKGKKR